MSPTPRVSAIAILASALSACAWAEDRLEQGTLKVGAFHRTYLLYVPDTVKPDQPTPVVFAFHGSGGQGHDMLCCRPWAKQRGWLLICPHGLDHVWHVGARDPAKADRRESDRALVPALLDAVSASRPIDRTRVYATGFSGGGGMAARLAVLAPELFAAVGYGGHTLTRDMAAKFPPAKPLSVLIMIGSNDPGLGNLGRAVNSLPATDAAANWAAFDGCGEATVTERPGGGDPTTVCETRYTGGKEGTEVALYWLIGTGHKWVNRGADPNRFDSGEAIFDFFARHQRAAGD